MKLFPALAFALLLTGCAQDEPVATGSTGSAEPAATTSTGTEPVKTEEPSDSASSGGSTASGQGAKYQPDKWDLDALNRKPKDGDEVAVMETNHGKIVLMFFPDKAPGHVENFKKLARKGFYDGVQFHRVIPGFMIQGGDPNTKGKDRSSYGQGGPGYEIRGEMNDVPHKRGVLSAARTADPNSAGSQFFIVVKDSEFLNPKRSSDGELIPGQEGYTVYGMVVSGMDVADKIVALPTEPPDMPLTSNPAVIKSVKIVKWPVK